MALSAQSYDPTLYPVNEKVGEDILQRLIMELLRPLVARWLAHQGSSDFVGADQFIYYTQHDPHARVAPDIYILPGVSADAHVTSWKTWESGIVPSLAIEIVSQRRSKDYYDAPGRYQDIGVEEFIIFDPHWATRVRGEGRCWQVYRQLDSQLRLVDSSREDRVRSKVLGCWLRSIGSERDVRVRLGVGDNGHTLFPTAEEAERAEKEAALEREQLALAEIERLRRELAAKK